MRRLLLAAFLMTAPLGAQDAPPDPVVALLEPEASLVTAGGSVAFRLRVDVTADCELDASVLGGTHLAFRVVDRDAVVVGEVAEQRHERALGDRRRGHVLGDQRDPEDDRECRQRGVEVHRTRSCAWCG